MARMEIGAKLAGLKVRLQVILCDIRVGNVPFRFTCTRGQRHSLRSDWSIG